MAKTLNPIADFISKSVSLHFELCALAESAYARGPKSGVKRTILLAIAEKPAIAVDDLADKFAGTDQIEGQSILKELGRDALIRFETRLGRSYVSLTEAGKAEVQKIVSYESSLAGFMPKNLKLADIHKAIQTIELMVETVADARAAAQDEEQKFEGPVAV